MVPALVSLELDTTFHPSDCLECAILVNSVDGSGCKVVVLNSITARLWHQRKDLENVQCKFDQSWKFLFCYDAINLLPGKFYVAAAGSRRFYTASMFMISQEFTPFAHTTDIDESFG